MSLRYQTFRLQIGRGPGRGYLAQVLLSPQGEGRQVEVDLDVPPDEITALNDDFGRTISGGRHVLVDDGERPQRSPEALGERLYAALFQGDVGNLYERSLEPLARDSEAGLRLELMLDPTDPDLAAVQALPWELIRKPGTAEFLALSPQRPVVRYLAVPSSLKEIRGPGILRILAVAADPFRRRLGPLDLESELGNLRQAVGASSGIKIVTPERPTLASVRKALLAHECHVLHFMGHGGSIPGQQEKVLFLETENGDEEPVRGTDLVNKLAGFPDLRLVVLNACESAALPDTGIGGEGFEPFAGVANTLVINGLPAVVAMQFPVSDEAAISFSRAFYERLAAGAPVDAAVTEGRQAVHSAHPSSFEWATPVLFLRSAEPERPQKKRLIVGVAVLVVAVLAVLAVLSIRQARALRVHTLVAEGADLAGHGNWTEARERFEAARRLDPQSATVLADLAGAEERLGDYKAAEEHYREAVRSQPRSADRLYDLGHFLNSRQRYADAYDTLLKSVALNPGRVDAYGDLAEAAASRGMYDLARGHLKTALDKDRDRPALHRRLGELELNAGQPREAVAHLSDARRYPMADREKAETAALLAQAYDRLDDSASACKEVVTFHLHDRPGITPWTPNVMDVAARRHCIPP